jgi:hypothetical protein
LLEKEKEELERLKKEQFDLQEKRKQERINLEKVIQL